MAQAGCCTIHLEQADAAPLNPACAVTANLQDVLSLYNRGQLRGGVQQLLQHIRARTEPQQAQRQLPAASRTKLQVKGMRCEGW